MRTGSSGVGDGATTNADLTDSEYKAGLRRTADTLRREREAQEQLEREGHGEPS